MPAHRAEMEEKKTKIAAVIDFCAAHAKDSKFSRTQIFLFFGVPQPTGARWFPSSYSPNRQQQQQTGPENATSPISSASHQSSPPPKRRNPVRNDGRGRKKLKSMIEDLRGADGCDGSPPPQFTPALSLASSSPAPEEPVTPPNRKIAQPKKTSGSRHSRPFKQEGEVEVKTEGFDDEIEV